MFTLMLFTDTKVLTTLSSNKITLFVYVGCKHVPARFLVHGCRTIGMMPFPIDLQHLPVNKKKIEVLKLIIRLINNVRTQKS